MWLHTGGFHARVTKAFFACQESGSRNSSGWVTSSQDKVTTLYRIRVWRGPSTRRAGRIWSVRRPALRTHAHQASHNLAHAGCRSLRADGPQSTPLRQASRGSRRRIKRGTWTSAPSSWASCFPPWLVKRRAAALQLRDHEVDAVAQDLQRGGWCGCCSSKKGPGGVSSTSSWPWCSLQKPPSCTPTLVLRHKPLGRSSLGPALSPLGAFSTLRRTLARRVGGRERRRLLAEKAKLATERRGRTLSWWRQREASLLSLRTVYEHVEPNHLCVWGTEIALPSASAGMLVCPLGRAGDSSRQAVARPTRSGPSRPSCGLRRSHTGSQDDPGGRARDAILHAAQFQALACGRRHCGPHSRLPSQMVANHHESGHAHGQRQAWRSWAFRSHRASQRCCSLNPMVSAKRRWRSCALGAPT